MKSNALHRAHLFVAVCSFLLPVSLPAQRPAASASAYEDTVNLQASRILQPGLLSTPLYRVRDLVVTDWGVNNFAIDTDLYGPFLAHGNAELLERMAEIGIMKRLDDTKRSEEYSTAVRKAAQWESEVSDDAVIDYVSPIEKEPLSGIGKFFHRIGREEADDIDEDDVREYKAFQRKSALAIAGAKLSLCRNLGVNPYTTNLMLQRKLDDVSKAIAIGGFMMAPIVVSPDDNLASAIYRSQITPQLGALVYAKNREQLRIQNQTALQQMGASAQDAAAFLSNGTFTPWQQTQFVTALQSLPGVTGRDILVRDAARSSTEETDAVFYAETAGLLAQLASQNWKIARIELNSRLPYCILSDGSVLLALHWDYARWSPTAERCANWLQTLQVNGKKPASVTLVISGLASAQCRQEMEKRGFKLMDRQVKGPLN